MGQGVGSRPSRRPAPVLAYRHTPGCSSVCHFERISRFPPYTRRVRRNRTFRNDALGPNHTVDDRLLLLLEQILEDELTPSAAACMHQRATLIELSQLDGREPELFGQIRHGSDRVLVVAR